MGTEPDIVGQSEYVEFPELDLLNVPARIDTGARTSTIWASDISEENGHLSFVLFDKGCELFNGRTFIFTEYETRSVKSSNGISEDRYMVKFLVRLGGRKIRARFTLANRSQQKYPVLIGRNVLRGKFIVDIKHNHVKVSKGR